MKKIKIEDIKKGEIYTSKSGYSANLFIWEASQNGVLKFRNRIFTREQKDVVNIGISESVSGTPHSWEDIYKSTSKEKQWLLNCVRLNKSISLEESNKIEKDKKKPLKSKILVDKNGKYSGIQTKEGAIFQIGDVVTPVEGVNKGKPFTIESFRWNNANTEICAITDTHKPYGIGIDKIELYIEVKLIIITESTKDMLILKSKGIDSIVLPNETLLDKAKRLYPIGTKFRVVHTPKTICEVKDHDLYRYQTDDICNLNIVTPVGNCRGGSVYYYGKWAEIIEEVDNFVLPEKWCVEVNSENQNFISSVRDRSCSFTFITSDLILPDVKNSWWSDTKAKSKGFTEITLEQFKKYVLNEN